MTESNGASPWSDSTLRSRREVPAGEEESPNVKGRFSFSLFKKRLGNTNRNDLRNYIDNKIKPLFSNKGRCILFLTLLFS